MGTPEFAVASLDVLISNDVDIVGVITAPDKPKGRGKVLQGSPVKVFAESKGLKILQPSNLKSESFIQELKSLNADLQVVVAFRMLPEVVWSMPSKGTFNLHGSLLPQYRGAAPINWAIINGEKETGVTTFFLKHQIDTGSIIFQEKEIIKKSDDVGSLYDRLMLKGANLVLKTIKAIEVNDYSLSEQTDDGHLKEAPKIFKETCEINWSNNAHDIFNFIRGLSPYPSAWTILNGKKYKIYKTEILERSSLDEGEISIQDSNKLLIGTATEDIELLVIQPEGKKKMNTEDYLRGNKI